MARIRSIKPELRTSEKVASWPIPVRYFWVLLWGFADDYGVGRDNFRLIKSDAFPLDDEITTDLVSEWMDLLEREGVIQRYEVDGSRYFHIVNWREHQKISHPAKRYLPPPPPTPEALRSVSGEAPETLGKTSDRSREGEQGKGAGRGRGEASDDAPPPRALDLPSGIQSAGAISFDLPSGNSPFCPKHPGGTDRPCFACKHAREEYEIRQPSKVMRRARAVMENFAGEGSDTDQRAITA